jgi:hypothetical protein
VGDLLVLLLVAHDSGRDRAVHTAHDGDRVGAVPAGRRLLSRRTTLALGVAGLVVVAGCDDDTDGADGPGGSGVLGSTPTPAADPDGDLVGVVLDELMGAEQLAVAGGFAGLASLHRDHIDALGGTPPTPPGTRRATADAVRRREKRLQSFLVESAVKAESGALARLLASMSAAVAQHLVDLPAQAS